MKQKTAVEKLDIYVCVTVFMLSTGASRGHPRRTSGRRMGRCGRATQELTLGSSAPVALTTGRPAGRHQSPSSQKYECIWTILSPPLRLRGHRLEYRLAPFRRFGVIYGIPDASREPSVDPHSQPSRLMMLNVISARRSPHPGPPHAAPLALAGPDRDLTTDTNRTKMASLTLYQSQRNH